MFSITVQYKSSPKMVSIIQLVSVQHRHIIRLSTYRSLISFFKKHKQIQRMTLTGGCHKFCSMKKSWFNCSERNCWDSILFILLYKTIYSQFNTFSMDMGTSGFVQVISFFVDSFLIKTHPWSTSTSPFSFSHLCEYCLSNRFSLTSNNFFTRLCSSK